MADNHRTLEERLTNIRIMESTPLVTPRELKDKYPLSEKAAKTVLDARKAIQDILNRKDDRYVIITGPCSIHDYDSAIKFGKRIKVLSDEVGDKVLLVMRGYLEKPRTGVDWEGYIPDPDLNGGCDLNKGYDQARKLLLELAEMGVPVATEIVDVRYTPQYIDDLIVWTAIGARTVESQDHRKIASGLSMPVGFKNNTAGDIKTAVDATNKARNGFRFPGVDLDLRGCVLKSNGNLDGHIILRGGGVNGGTMPNYYDESVSEATRLLEAAGLPLNIMVDCSHANSNKDYRNQPLVFNRVLQQRIEGNRNIFGVMLETHIKEGKQKFKYGEDDPGKLDAYQSMTDACISWETNERLIREAYDKLSLVDN